MVQLEDIKKLTKEEFSVFEKTFDEAFSSDNDILKFVNSYILRKKGKQIRPLLTFLAARLCGKSNQNTINSAIALEMLHTASLVHDDIVDEAEERRGQKSVNAIWNNKISVLTGDYIVAQAMYLATKTKNIDIICTITIIGKELTDGELMQISNVKNISTSEENYFKVIEKKTAVLFAACMKCGAISTNATTDKIEKIREFGKIYGLIFQIKDDIFDYISSEKEIGKPVGNDIREGKITLPLLFALKKASDKEREKYLQIIRNKDFTKENIEKIISFAIEKKGIEYSIEKMNQLKEKAIELLSDFPDSDIKRAIIDILQYTINRNK